MSRNAALGLVPLASVPREAWDSLAAAPVDPNGFFDAGFSLSSAAFAHNGRGAKALIAYDQGRLTGVLPVATARRALKLPLPVLVSTQPYNSLTTPLLDRADPARTAGALIDAAAASRCVAAGAADGRHGRPGFRSSRRRSPSAGRHRLRRQRLPARRARDRYRRRDLFPFRPRCQKAQGAASPAQPPRRRRRGHVRRRRDSHRCAAALDGFLDLEASGWKGKRGTALAKHAGDTEFIRRAIADLAADGNAEIATLARDGTPVAAGLLLRQAAASISSRSPMTKLRALSPGVQLCSNSHAIFARTRRWKPPIPPRSPNHPMIDRIWRDRLHDRRRARPHPARTFPFHFFAGIVSARHAARQAARRGSPFHPLANGENR